MSLRQVPLDVLLDILHTGPASLQAIVSAELARRESTPDARVAWALQELSTAWRALDDAQADLAPVEGLSEVYDAVGLMRVNLERLIQVLKVRP